VPSEQQITRKIRKALMADESLSTYAQHQGDHPGRQGDAEGAGAYSADEKKTVE
jgi:hypothetical protein